MEIPDPNNMASLSVWMVCEECDEIIKFQMRYTLFRIMKDFSKKNGIEDKKLDEMIEEIKKKLYGKATIIEFSRNSEKVPVSSTGRVPSWCDLGVVCKEE